MSLMQLAAQQALAAVRAASGVSVTITRGASTGQPIKPAVGKREWDVESKEGLFETWISRDYLIAASDYTPAGTVTEPASGDVITETINNLSKTYLVCAPKGLRVFEYSDEQQTALRVHTKENT